MCMTLFRHWAEERRKFCRSICTAVRKTRRGKYMRPMDARSRKNGCPVRCHKALKTTRQQKSIFIRVESMLVRGLQVPVVDLERSSMEAGSREYILSRARMFT